MATPAEAARSHYDKEGFVFLDSAQGEGISFLGTAPDLIIAGTSEDWPRLEEEIAARARPRSPRGVPESGAVGWVGFDGRFCFGFYENLFAFDHATNQWITDAPPEGRQDLRRTTPCRPDFRPAIGRDEYVKMVERAKEYIAAGDIYQACLSYPFRGHFDGHPSDYYEALREVSPAPYCAFLNLHGTQIASASPECFLTMIGRTVFTRPIKGTRRRESDAGLDAMAAKDLLASPKEMAELIMITDLERNDLGRICEYGSVQVTELLKHERYRQVHHLVSTVQGTLRSDISHPSALLACSPGGSISGAPKIRALEIIRELESWDRGIYTGAIGCFGFDGESRFSIAIRTAVFEGNTVEFGVGAGIVADSSPAQEWQETLDKAAGLLAAADVHLR
jgi:anthranilate/para-aminobenzoate synthase component I